MHVLELVEEYLNAVPELTISNEERERDEKLQLQNKNKQLTIQREEFENLKTDLEHQKSMAEGLMKIKNLEKLLRLMDKEDGLGRLEKYFDHLQETQNK